MDVTKAYLFKEGFFFCHVLNVELDSGHLHDFGRCPSSLRSFDSKVEPVDVPRTVRIISNKDIIDISFFFSNSVKVATLKVRVKLQPMD